MVESLQYVKKITTALGWLRRLDAKDPATDAVIKMDPQPIMRLKAILVEGWEENSDLGPFIRWIGKIGCIAMNRDGSQSNYISRNLIMPPVVSDYITGAFKQTAKETNVKGRTGQYFSLPDDFVELPVVIDIYIKQPTPGKVSATGYEFDMRIVKGPEMSNPVDLLDSDAPKFGQKALPKQDTAPTADAAKFSDAETKPPADAGDHKAEGGHKGKRATA